MRRWLIVCLLAACERAGESQNPLGTGGELVTGPIGSRALIDASIATLPNDAAPVVADAKPVVADAAVARADAGRRRNDMFMTADDARRIADLLTSGSPSGLPQGDMSRRRPGADLSKQLEDVRGAGRSVDIGAGGGRRGGGAARVGSGTISTGGGPKIDAIDSRRGPVGRVSVSSKRAFDDSSLTSDMVIRKIAAAYMAAIKRCYKQHLERDPTARGRVTLAFEVVETGRLEKRRASGFARDLDVCLAGRMTSWRFPTPKDKDGEAMTASFEVALQLVPD